MKKRKRYYHISVENIIPDKNNTITFVPSLPKTASKKIEGNIPRICVSDNIYLCCRSIIGRIENYITETMWWNESGKRYISTKDFQRIKLELKEKIGKKNLNFKKNSYCIDVFFLQISPEDIHEIVKAFAPYVSQICFLSINIEKEEMFNFFIIKNPQILIPIEDEKPYIPPNVSDFKKNHEHWFIKNTKFTIIGRLNMKELFSKQEICTTDNSYYVVNNISKKKLYKSQVKNSHL